MGMDEERLEALLQANKRTLAVVWLALLAEPLVYALLPWIVSAAQIEIPEQNLSSSWRWGAFLLAVVLALASLALHRYMLSNRQIKVRLAIARVEAREPSLGSSLSKAQLLSLTAYYRTVMLMVWALNGSVPIGGLVLLFTSGDTRTIFVLSVLAVVLNLLSHPQLDAFIERAENFMDEEWM
jgi:MFS family permease